MKYVSKALCLVASCLCFSSALNAADLDTGIYQLNRGDFKGAIAEFEPLVAEQYAPAQYQMALIHQNGWGVKKDKQKALELMNASANQNYPDALFSLSVMYSEGNLVKKDLKTAFTLMEKAAKKNLTSAQFNVGVMFANGDGVTKDSKKAASWYKKAARQNYALAQFNLALMYFEGIGVQKSLSESYIWNYIAAKSGYVPAQKSRDMDEQKLTIKQIQSMREEAERRYTNILDQIELRAKKADEVLF